MDYTKHTKEELIELVKEGRHLKSAVESKDKEINELKAQIEINKQLQKSEIATIKQELEDSRKSLKSQYENEIKELKQRVRESEMSVEVLSDKKLSDIRASFNKTEQQMQADLKTVRDIAIKKSKELEEALDIIKSIHRAFQGSLDMSINLTSYFEDKVTKGE